jgi:endoglucanase
LGDCEGQGDRVALLAGAAKILDEAGGKVFLDVGHSNWETPETMAERVALVGSEHLTGFATNTSNYNATDREVAFGMALSELTGLPFITDTSRNGNGATDDGQWCNPRGRALGETPMVFGDDGPLLAYVWGKVPGESDGECNGGPAAGQWWQEIAEELARNA